VRSSGTSENLERGMDILATSWISPILPDAMKRECCKLQTTVPMPFFDILNIMILVTLTRYYLVLIDDIKILLPMA